MFHLTPLMLEKAGIIVIAAFLLSKMKLFRHIIRNEHNRKEKLLLILLFGATLVTKLTKSVLVSGKLAVAKTKENISCDHPDCPLEGAIVMPLKVKNKIVGTLKMYYTESGKLDSVQQELAEGKT